jgi:tRNA(Arg) A34 adenosine deaminase TadA
MFIEVVAAPSSSTSKGNLPRYIEVYVAAVESKLCGALLKRLSDELPLKAAGDDGVADLTHLKRVKKTLTESVEGSGQVDIITDGASKTKKRPRSKAAMRLEVVMGDVPRIDRSYTHPVDELQAMYNVTSVFKRLVPSRPAESEQERLEFQSYWPVVYFEHRTMECRARGLCLNAEEITAMNDGMKAALQDANMYPLTAHPSTGTVVVDPKTGQICARSSEERKLQHADRNINPLATSVLMAVQGVSRQERQAAVSQGLDSAVFHAGQYLCTGLDVYCTHEPTTFEAMALVHARIRRLVFGFQCKDALGGLTVMSVHALPGTNHKYRAFCCQEGSELEQACRKLHAQHEALTNQSPVAQCSL